MLLPPGSGGARQLRDLSEEIRRTVVVPAALSVTVTDGGTGLAAAGGHGHELAIMRDRAGELGGTVTVSDTRRGVAVHSRLPAVTAPAQASSAAALWPALTRRWPRTT